MPSIHSCRPSLLRAASKNTHYNPEKEGNIVFLSSNLCVRYSWCAWLAERRQAQGYNPSVKAGYKGDDGRRQITWTKDKSSSRFTLLKIAGLCLTCSLMASRPHLQIDMQGLYNIPLCTREFKSDRKEDRISPSQFNPRTRPQISTTSLIHACSPVIHFPPEISLSHLTSWCGGRVMCFSPIFLISLSHSSFPLSSSNSIQRIDETRRRFNRNRCFQRVRTCARQCR